MGKVLFISDIHGNMPAVHAMEKEIEKIQPDEIWFLGDAVGKGPENDKAIDWVRAHCDHVIRGNWDQYVINTHRKGVWPQNQFYCKQIGEERIQYLESLPFEAECLISGMWFRILHGRPTDRLYQAFDSFDELKQGFKSEVFDRKFDGYIAADSHMPYFRLCKLGYAINTGSIGNSICYPRVHGILIEGEIGAAELSAIHCDIISIPYDNQAAADVIDLYPDAPAKDAYKTEVLTGIYSRTDKVKE